MAAVFFAAHPTAFAAVAYRLPLACQHLSVNLPEGNSHEKTPDRSCYRPRIRLPVDPDVAFASAVPVTIEIKRDGAPIGTSGEGWTYADGSSRLARGTRSRSRATRSTSRARTSFGTKVIEDGTFVDASQTSGFAVRNEAGGVIRAARSPQASETRASSQVEPSTATRTIPKIVRDTSSGTITGGTFDCMVMGMRSGAIEDGTFNESVNIFKGFAINGGTFNGEVNSGNSSNLGGSICGGTFNGRMQNQGTIEDGVFHGTVQNASNNAGASAIAGGTFNGYVNNYDGA
ncbi:MAG: hypothetical protein ACLSVD_05250 [Eggerthellaceae bacterium]